MADRHVLVVGGGIVGLSAAYFLARQGERVTVLDAGDGMSSASAGNAGLVALGHGPLPRPGLARHAMRWMFDPASPLYIAPRPRLDLVRWFWRFHRSCAPRWYTRSLEILMRHGHEAGRCFTALVEAESIECGFCPTGQLDVYRTEAGLQAGRDQADALRRGGYDATILDTAALREREPAFRDTVRGAVLYRDRAFADPGRFMDGLATATRRHHGTIRHNARVCTIDVATDTATGVTLENGERVGADRIILAAGIWTTPLAATAGVRIPMEPGKGYHINLDPPPVPLTTACVCGERFVAVTPMPGFLRLAGTLEFSGINHRFRPRRIDRLRDGAALYLEGVADRPARSVWCGLRPCTADGLPVIGWAPGVRGLFVATGHAMMGFTLGPLAGALAAQAVTGETPADLAPFDPARFRRKTA